MAPFSDEISPKMPSKLPSRRPWTPQPGAQNAPGTIQEAPKMRQEPSKSCPRAVQETTHRSLGAKTRHKAAPNSLQISILSHFGDDLEGFWNHFGWIFGRIFKQIGSIFSQLSAGSAWDLRPPSPPPCLEERTVAGTPLCGARDMYLSLL